MGSTYSVRLDAGTAIFAEAWFRERQVGERLVLQFGAPGADEASAEIEIEYADRHANALADVFTQLAQGIRMRSVRATGRQLKEKTT